MQVVRLASCFLVGAEAGGPGGDFRSFLNCYEEFASRQGASASSTGNYVHCPSTFVEGTGY